MTVTVEYETEDHLNLPETQIIEQVVTEALDYENCPYEAEVNVLLTDNPSIQEINRQQRQVDSPTDVLSFPMIDYASPSDFSHVEEAVEDYFNPETGELLLGDIVICSQVVCEQAEEYGHSTLREFSFLCVHSLLHLFGYDHIDENDRLEMERVQKEYMQKLQINR